MNMNLRHFLLAHILGVQPNRPDEEHKKHAGYRTAARGACISFQHVLAYLQSTPEKTAARAFCRQQQPSLLMMMPVLPLLVLLMSILHFVASNIFSRARTTAAHAQRIPPQDLQPPPVGLSERWQAHPKSASYHVGMALSLPLCLLQQPPK